MGTSFQVVLAAGTSSAGVHDAIGAAGQGATVIPIGEQRWAILPGKGEDDGYAETDDLARLSSRPPGAVAAALQVFDSDVLTADPSRAQWRASPTFAQRAGPATSPAMPKPLPPTRQ
jgi:hypothetical protein